MLSGEGVSMEVGDENAVGVDDGSMQRVCDEALFVPEVHTEEVGYAVDLEWGAAEEVPDGGIGMKRRGVAGERVPAIVLGVDVDG